MIRHIIGLFLLLGPLASARADIYQPFPGFENLSMRAEFIGIVTLTRRDTPDSRIFIGSGRNFAIRSIIVFKGMLLDDVIARLGDWRLQHDGSAFHPKPKGEILTPEKRFLVFLVPSFEKDSGFAWTAINAEGAVLPVSSITSLGQLDVKKPMECYQKIVEDYTLQCKADYEQALRQQEIIEKVNEQKPAPEGGISITPEPPARK